MKMVIKKNVSVDGKQFYKNDVVFLKAIERYTEKNNGEYMYLVESGGKLYSIEKKFIDFE